MRTAFMDRPGHIELIETEPPTIQTPNEVLIQVKTVGICGSEVHAYENTHPYRKAPVILGHEMAGDVIEVGSVVSRFAVGERVIVDPQWVCGECDYCRAGDINLCLHKKVLGTPDWPGAFGEYIVVPQEAVFHLPDSLTYQQGCLIEPLTVGVHVARRAGLTPGQSVAILGSGSIGGLLSGVCSALGADPIIVADIRQHCLDAARECLGATHDILLPHDDLVGAVKEIAGEQGVDVAFITADDPWLVSRAVEMVKRRGTVVLVALLTAEPLSLTAYEIIGKERHLIGSSMSTNEDVKKAIELVANDTINVEGIVTHVLPIEEAAHGMELAATKDDGAIKVVLAF
jgi:2-desacetyl-2-hydroxyethyl bacteriochlorophyllide A dehydrogenase